MKFPGKPRRSARISVGGQLKPLRTLLSGVKIMLKFCEKARSELATRLALLSLGGGGKGVLSALPGLFLFAPCASSPSPKYKNSPLIVLNLEFSVN
ncbi:MULTISPECIES: hypothetical protein [unclassified Rhizobium]|uniref:hypothetical protein n=1 Tax=unclassified Rhizobium TaxID=2613769 RepID=UPI001AD97D94|nr:MULTISPECIES: hypothetical protein [unclassified Rhizobium]MBO9099928.1 hypothetical protein [Rhizobium sp. L58/93]MBO9135860.1 hypothetical protein [Rhizobium sp. B209b/85]MBO9169917.1 hypothetical protein [Rhizobium sp. L245/93]MBO9185875.1 hypothetical protein [Rhizobium sp. E27B/91]QXZ82743.1 hypothetical protein J5287_11670 [Rhizobium sp. K1/93]